MRGRKPDALAVRRGGTTADIIANAQVVEESALVKPERVAIDPYMDEMWDTMIGTGAAFEPCDSPMLEQLIFQIRIVEDCRAHLFDAEGNVRTVVKEETDMGDILIKVNPYLKIMNDAEKSVMKLSQELGLTRFARARLGLTQAMGQAAQLSIAEQIDRAISGRK